MFERLTNVGIRTQRVPVTMLSSEEEELLITGLRTEATRMPNVSVEHALTANISIQAAAFLTDGTKSQFFNLIDSKVVVRPPLGKTHLRSP